MKKDNKSAAALRESEEKHRLLVENSHDIIYTLTAEGVFMFVSPAWTTLLGHPLTQVAGRPFQQFVHPDDLPGCFDFLQKVIATGQRQEGVEYRVKHTNGTWYWHTSSAVPLRDEAGTVIGFEGTARDITKRKQAEELLQQTRHNYETFFNTIDEFLFVLDEQGNIIHTNSTVIDRLGYTQEELFGKSVLMVHPPERRDEAGRIVGEMLSGSAEFCPVPIVTKSGVQIPVETRVSHGFWDGKPAIFGVTKDITNVRLSEEKFSKVFYLNPSACGLSGLDDRKYYEVNEAFYALFGFNKDEVIGKTAMELGILTPEARNAIRHKVDSNGRATNVEADLKAKNGDIKHVLLSAENINVQDKKYRFTVVHDVTERKRAEHEIKLKSEELSKLNVQKDKFFSIIAHDLRNPFNSFLGFTRMMVEDLPSLRLDEIQKIALMMRNSATNLYSLLENLLEWSRMQRGLTSFDPESFLLMPKITESMLSVLGLANKKEIGISYDIDENLKVFADANMLESAIRNLATNAVKFTSRGGNITITAKSIEDNPVKISIRDTGIGMNKDMLDKLFQLDEDTSRNGTEGEPSTGLGLIICKDFVEKQGGKIWVESEPGKGSTFYFTLPNSKEV